MRKAAGSGGLGGTADEFLTELMKKDDQKLRTIGLCDDF
jgi:hypothetical protein